MSVRNLVFGKVAINSKSNHTPPYHFRPAPTSRASLTFSAGSDTALRGVERRTTTRAPSGAGTRPTCFAPPSAPSREGDVRRAFARFLRQKDIFRKSYPGFS